jgi:hypothetical protein
VHLQPFERYRVTHRLVIRAGTTTNLVSSCPRRVAPKVGDERDDRRDEQRHPDGERARTCAALRDLDSTLNWVVGGCHIPMGPRKLVSSLGPRHTLGSAGSATAMREQPAGEMPYHHHSAVHPAHIRRGASRLRDAD